MRSDSVGVVKTSSKNQTGGIVDFAVSKSFRKLIISIFPKLGQDITLWRLLGHLIFVPMPDEKTGCQVVFFNYLALLEEKEKLLEHNHYNATTYLQRLEKALSGSNVTIDLGSVRSGQARTASLNFSQSQEILKSISAELSRPPAKNSVYFSSGRAISRQSKADERRSRDEEARRMIDLYPHPAEIIVKYYLDRPFNRWTRLIDKHSIDRTEREIRKHYSKISKKSSRKRSEMARQLYYIHSIKDFAKPTYFLSNNTDRVFTRYISLRSIKKEFRRKLLSGCYEYDLTSCHLAIASRVWGATALQRFLMQGGDFWKFCIENYRPLEDANDLLNNESRVVQSIKDLVKKGIYSFLNGWDEKQLEIHLTKPRKLVHNRSEFFNSSILQSLIQARRQFIALLQNQGYLVDAFGRKLDMGNNWKRSDFIACRSLGSLLARQITSFEVAIMREVYKLAIDHESKQKAKGESPEFYIVLDLHDAIVINYTKNTREKWEPIIMNHIKTFTHSAGIYTSLSLKG